MAKKWSKEDVVEGHPSLDNSDRFIGDQWLRKHGFAIHQRKGNKEPLWRRGGSVFSQSEAELLVAEEEWFTESKERG